MLSKNFDMSEFKCPCCGKIMVHPVLVTRLQKIADYFKEPVIINSGYRCYKHDIEVGGNGTGAHTMGIAVDIHIPNVKSIDIAKIAEKIGFGGIGIITDNDIHLDIRDMSGYDVSMFSYDNKKWFGNEMTCETYNTFN